MAWLLFLAPFFFLTYNFANAAAGRRADLAVVRFPWERQIPFLSWTILPYWSSDLLYGISLGICGAREELDLHGKRLIAIQVFAIACFLAFPMRCTWERPAFGGWDGEMFAALYRFDQPYNQAPSLHVALAVILWTRFRAHTTGWLRMALSGWFVLVAVSTLTTYQHQFIDLPMGAWAGVLVLAALPERRVAEQQWKLASYYLVGSIACTVGAFALRGFGWLLLWPGFALSMVAAAYWTGDAAWLGARTGKTACPTTRVEQAVPPVRWLMLPYTLAAWVNSRLWTRGEAPKNHLAGEVWMGRAPSAADRKGMKSLVTLAPELSVRGEAHVEMLDLMPPTLDQLDEAVRAIEGLAERRPTLVCCALGYSRSAITAAAWMIAAGHARDANDAVSQVRRARPQVVVGEKYRLRLEQWAAERMCKDVGDGR